MSFISCLHSYFLSFVDTCLSFYVSIHSFFRIYVYLSSHCAITSLRNGILPPKLPINLSTDMYVSLGLFI
jgi:accessory gene regulator protein AgrB